MGSPQTIRPETGLIRVPPNYPTVPTPGKLEFLLQANDKSIYHRYSPHTDYDNGDFLNRLLNFGAKQPYIYSYIDEGRKGLNGLKKYESRLFPIGSGPQDVIRVSKFIGSGAGVIFLGRQFLLQAGNVFDETRLYNPTSPIVAAGMSLTFGTVRPQRNFDLSGGLGGIARTLIGNSIPNLFGDGTTGVPSSLGSAVLPDANKKTDGKGVLRDDTAGTGYAHFTKKWSDTSNAKFSWKEFGKSLINSFIPNTFRKSQPPGTVFRADEGAYGVMLQTGATRYVYVGSSGASFKFGQLWAAGGKGIRKDGQYNLTPSKLIAQANGTWKEIDASGGIVEDISGVGLIGYNIQPSNNKDGYRYGDSVGTKVDEDYASSDVMLQYGEFIKQDQQFPTKRVDKKAVDKTKENLKKVIDSVQKSGVYKVNVIDPESRVLSSVNQTINGYDKIFQTTDGQPGKSAKLYPLGVLNSYRYRDIRMVDNSITDAPVQNSLKLPGAGNFDAINTLRILPGDKSGNPRYNKFSQLPQWNTWEPYRDDQIAFYFYDVVNDKYIPFRATVQGINETAASNWEELSFIGRADRLYSYGGFTRTLSFTFDIHISSVIELAPTWKRINYLMTLVKPSRYTKSNDNLNFNKFMVPPMVMLTMGDLYKKQPVIIQSVGMSVPDDAIWETLNEFNTTAKEWSYLVDYFKSNQIRSDGLEYGQFPRTVKMTLNCMLLEKERAIAGAANFGHAPHTDDYLPMDIADQPYMHQALVEYQFDHTTTPTYTDERKTTQNPDPEFLTTDSPPASPSSKNPVKLLPGDSSQKLNLPPVDSLSKTNLFKIKQETIKLPNNFVPGGGQFGGAGAGNQIP